MADDFNFDLFSVLNTTLAKATALRLKGKHQECLELLNGLPDLFQDGPDVLHLRARCHFENGQAQQAFDVLNRLLALIPSDVNAAVLRARCLFDLDQKPAALAGVRQVIQLHPHSAAALEAEIEMRVTTEEPLTIITELNQLASVIQDSKALGAVVERVRGKLLALFEVSDLMAADPTDILQLRVSDGGSTYNLRHIYTCFEPVGSSCEFGGVQRLHGAEPLALFRWTGIHHAHLLRLLHAQLVDFDLPERYSLGRYPQGEYMLRDSEYGTDSHTGLKPSDISAEVFLEKLRRRQIFLKRKFLEDATAGKKIFLHRTLHALSESQMAELHRAFEGLGVKQTLFVLPPSAAHPAGSFHLRTAQSMVGYLAQNNAQANLAGWDKIIVGAYDTFKPDLVRSA